MNGAGGVRAGAGSASPALRPLVLALLLAWALVLLPALPAAAHARLVDSDPADGERLSAVPAAVRLTFSGDIEPTLAVAAVTAPGGTRAQVVPEVAGRDVVVAVSEGTNGEYTVAFRVVSEDGHAVSGTVSFTVVGPPTPTPTTAASTATAPTTAGQVATSTPTPSATSTGTPSAPSTSPGSRTAAAAALALVLAAAGAAAAVLVRRRRGAS